MSCKKRTQAISRELRALEASGVLLGGTKRLTRSRETGDSDGVSVLLARDGRAIAVGQGEGLADVLRGRARAGVVGRVARAGRATVGAGEEEVARPGVEID